MNVFFIIDSVAITPSLEEGTILAGVTRDSVITLLKELGYKTEERRISIDELFTAYTNGTLNEVFGTGTAATIALIKELRYKNDSMYFNTDNFRAAQTIKKRMDDIKEGRAEDVYGWLLKV
jgi:branched-chain amino acid aminotransferase